MRILALIAVLASVPAVAASTDSDQAQAAERLAARAQDALDRIVGPGRSKVELDVVGEHAELNSQTELYSPVIKPVPPSKEPAHLVDLPGYVKEKPHPEKPDASTPQSYMKENEASRHDAGFQIRAIHATVVFDSALDSATVREASQVLPQILGLDTTRGDTLGFLRATLRPLWMSAFATPSEWRSAVYALGAGLLVLLVALISVAGLVSAGRALGGSFGRELAAARAEKAVEAALAEELPELSPGAAGFLEGASAAGGGDAATPLLGRRFDFLIGRDPDLIVRAVSTEKPEALSLFFGHLAESIPDLASRLFSHLPLEVQADVSQSLLKLRVADPESLTEIEERLRLALENGVMGPQSLGRMLSRVPGEARADLLGRLAARDAHAAEEVESHMFSFEDLDGIGAASLRRLLGAVPYVTWGTALRGAPRALIEAVLLDLPDGPRELVRAAAEVPQPRDKIDEARSKILEAVSELEAKGEIALDRARRDEDLV